MITRVVLLLSFLACVAFSQSFMGSSTRCLCRKTQDSLKVHPKKILNMEVISPSNSCERIEIIVNLKNGLKYCLNPDIQKIREMVEKMQKKRPKGNVKQTSLTS